MSKAVIEHLMDIKERCARMEQKLDDHVSMCAERDAKVNGLERDVIKAKASVKTLRWVAWAIAVVLPVSAAAVYRIFNS